MDEIRKEPTAGATENKAESKNETKAKATEAKAAAADAKAVEAGDAKTDGKTVKTRQGSGYLRQLYSTARNTAGTNSSNFRSTTTFLVNFIPVDKVDVSEYQVRTHFDEAEVVALSESIKLHGVLQPILVTQNGDRYKVIAGERRLRASKMAGLERIPARVINSDDKAVHEIALRENLDRVDLHPLEEGEGYLSLLEAQAYTSHEGISQAFGKPKSRITECIGYTRLPATTKEELLRRGIKQRAVLRKLLETPPEGHLEIIGQVASIEDNMMNHVGGQAPGHSAAPVETPKAAQKTEAKPFSYKCTKKAVSVPGFRWKAGEGPARLKDYLEKMKTFLDEAKTIL